MKKLLAFGIFNMAVLVMAMITLTFAHRQASRYFAPNVALIASNTASWTVAEVTELAEMFPQYGLAYKGEGFALVETDLTRHATGVSYVNSLYFNMHFLNFVAGSHWADVGQYVVLSQGLAWQLFGSFNIVGAVVSIYGMPYTITGVAGYEGIRAWLPYQQSTLFTALFIQPIHYNLVDIMATANQMLVCQYRHPGSYQITDINRYVEAIGIRGRLLVYLLWVYVLGICIYKVRKYYVLAIPIGVGGFVLFTGIHEILYWLPNLSIPGNTLVAVFANLSPLPHDNLVAHNTTANIAWITGAVALANISVLTWVLKGEDVL